MRSESYSGGSAAIEAAPASERESPADDAEQKITPGCESNPHEWFFLAARRLLGKDAGYALHRITGYPESSCYAYVAKDARNRRRPPEHFIRTLIHSDEGEPFYDAFMAGCAAGWWIERQIQRDKIRQHIATLQQLIRED